MQKTKKLFCDTGTKHEIEAREIKLNENDLISKMYFLGKYFNNLKVTAVRNFKISNQNYF